MLRRFVSILLRASVFWRASQISAAASVESDVLYLVPGEDGYALTTEDLLSQNYHYLRSLA